MVKMAFHFSLMKAIPTFPGTGLAFLLDAMIEDGDYPNPVVEEQPDPIGDYNIPDEVDEMGGPHRQMTIGEADFDYVLMLLPMKPEKP